MSTIINTAKDCSVRAFMTAAFDSNLRVLIIDGDPTEEELLEAFTTINEEYQDLAGAQQSEGLDLLKQVKYLRARLETVYNFIKIHRTCIAEVGEPFHPALADLKKFGYRLKWDKDSPDVLQFLRDLEAIQRKEKRTEAELLNKMRALEVIEQRSKGRKDASPKQQRIGFVSLLNSLGKYGFQIDKDKTSMEELALMTKDYTANMEAQINKKRR